MDRRQGTAGNLLAQSPQNGLTPDSQRDKEVLSRTIADALGLPPTSTTFQGLPMSPCHPNLAPRDTPTGPVKGHSLSCQKPDFHSQTPTALPVSPPMLHSALPLIAFTSGSMDFGHHAVRVPAAHKSKHFTERVVTNRRTIVPV